MNQIILKIARIGKSFSGVKVLKNISLEIYKGEIHAIVGENGAGKSTLMKIISGEYSPTFGELFVDNVKRKIYSPTEALKEGIMIVHQEFSLVPQLSVYENIFLGRWKVNNKNIPIIKKSILKSQTKEIFKKLGINHIPPDAKVSSLSIGDKQIVEIAKALSVNPRILILDEPTAALSLDETKALFKVLKNLKKHEITILYISHRLEEIFEIADRVTVLRNGELVFSSNISNVGLNDLISQMVGRSLNNRYPEKTSKEIGKVILKVENLSSQFFKRVSFEVSEGEILGITGLIGSGSSQLAETIFGLRKFFEGSINYYNQKFMPKNPKKSIDKGIYYVPGDRHLLGLVLKRSMRENHALPNLNIFSKFGILNNKKEKNSATKIVKELNIKIKNLNQKVENLSGGNQQKVVIGKWLIRSPKLLILDEPTRGIDVGAKYEIYKLINELSKNNVAIILVSSNMEEVINLCDRVIVMSEGRISGEINPKFSTKEEILSLAVKGKEE